MADGPLAALILVVACYSFPYVFVLTKSALDLISSEMEDAANILGASNMRTTLTITMPHGCNLKEQTEAEQLIGEKYLRRWGILRDI